MRRARRCRTPAPVGKPDASLSVPGGGGGPGSGLGGRHGIGAPVGCLGSAARRHAAWLRGPPARSGASSSDPRDRSGGTGRRPAGSRIARRRRTGTNPPAPARRRGDRQSPRSMRRRRPLQSPPRDSARGPGVARLRALTLTRRPLGRSTSSHFRCATAPRHPTGLAGLPVAIPALLGDVQQHENRRAEDADLGAAAVAPPLQDEVASADLA